MTTKNEYIASIMLEAADLLKSDNSYYNNIESIREDYYNYQLLRDSANKAVALCESIDRMMYKYENDIYYSLNESVRSSIWDAIKKLFDIIKGWWTRFRKWLKGGKRVAKKNAKVVDPSKAKKVVEETVKAYNSNSDTEQYEATIDNIESKISDAKKEVKEGDSIPDYESLGNTVDANVAVLEKDYNKAKAANDEETAKRAKEALNIITKMNNEISKSSQIFLLPAGDEFNTTKTTYEYRKNGTMVKHDELNIPNRSFKVDTYYRSGEPYKERHKYRSKEGDYLFDNYRSKKTSSHRSPIYTGIDRWTTHQPNNDSKENKVLYVDEKGGAADVLSKKVRNAKKKKAVAKAKGKLNETIEFLYDEAILAETVEEFDTIMEAIEALED